MKIVPNSDRVIIETHAKLKTHHHACSNILEGTIRICGPGVKNFKSGDRVLFHSLSGHTFDGGQKIMLRIMHEDEILAKHK